MEGAGIRAAVEKEALAEVRSTTRAGEPTRDDDDAGGSGDASVLGDDGLRIDSAGVSSSGEKLVLRITTTNSKTLFRMMMMMMMMMRSRHGCPRVVFLRRVSIIRRHLSPLPPQSSSINRGWKPEEEVLCTSKLIQLCEYTMFFPLISVLLST